MGTKRATSENGRLKLILAILIAGAVAVMALAYDGGNSSEVVNTAQDAADAGALGGVLYLSEIEENSEAGLIAAINRIVESNGIPDTDGKGANEKNDNVAAYYTNENGDRIAGCSEVGGRSPGAEVRTCSLRVRTTGNESSRADGRTAS